MWAPAGCRHRAVPGGVGSGVAGSGREADRLPGGPVWRRPCNGYRVAVVPGRHPYPCPAGGPWRRRWLRWRARLARCRGQVLTAAGAAPATAPGKVGLPGNALVLATQRSRRRPGKVGSPRSVTGAGLGQDRPAPAPAPAPARPGSATHRTRRRPEPVAARPGGRFPGMNGSGMPRRREAGAAADFPESERGRRPRATLSLGRGSAWCGPPPAGGPGSPPTRAARHLPRGGADERPGTPAAGTVRGLARAGHGTGGKGSPARGPVRPARQGPHGTERHGPARHGRVRRGRRRAAPRASYRRSGQGGRHAPWTGTRARAGRNPVGDEGPATGPATGVPPGAAAA